MSQPVKAAILTIGDEILYGQTLDTNAHWLSQELDAHGFKVSVRLTVSDKEEDILNGLKVASDAAKVILITGGLGPTADDLTKPCLAKYFKVDLVSNVAALEELKQLFKRIDKPLSETNIAQTNLPANAQHLSNAMGTAPGIWIEDNDKIFVSMPGVPFEMKTMATDQVIPRLVKQLTLTPVKHRIIRTIGIGESWLAEKIKPWVDGLPDHLSLAYLPGIGQVKLRLTSSGPDPDATKLDFDKAVEELYHYVGRYIYATGEIEIQETLGQVLKDRKMLLGTAESCTGGYLAHLITSIPGSSSYFKGSIIAYDNEVKQTKLSVSESVLDNKGAVSEETVAAMAQGVCTNLGVNIGLATSGIAGPDGGTAEKPVGTIWIAVAVNGKVETKLLKLYKDRVLNIKATAVATLALLWRILSK